MTDAVDRRTIDGDVISFAARCGLGSPRRVRLWPLILRELREQSRRPLNHGLRAAGAVGLLAATAYFLWQPMLRAAWGRGVPGGAAVPAWTQALTTAEWLGAAGAMLRSYENRGGALFAAMNFVLLGIIWFLAPLVTADCVSRERRDGTLGLLFLTPLRAVDIVLAKLLAHGLRAASLFVGALPVLILPVLLGGVSWMDVARVGLWDAGALVLALTAGLRASSVWQGPRAVLFGALAFAVALAFTWVFGWAALRAVGGGAPEGIPERLLLNLKSVAMLVPATLRQPTAVTLLTGGVGVMRPAQLILPAALLGVSAVLAAVEVTAAARLVARVQRQGRTPGLAEAAEAALTRPAWPADHWRRLAGWLRRRDPVFWAELNHWRLRIAPWMMLLATGLVAAWRTLEDAAAGSPMATTSRALTLLLAVSAAASFQRERAAGVLELLLTTPGGAGRVLRCKLGATALQAFPSALLIVGAEVLWREAWYGESWWQSSAAAGGAVAVVLGLGGRLALVGTAGAFFGLRFRTYLPALLATLGTGMLAPMLVGIALGRVPLPGVRPAAGGIHSASVSAFDGWVGGLVAGGLEALLALLFGLLLHRALARRWFATH